MKDLSHLNKKCGEIKYCTQVGKRVYTLNCLYCPQIYLQWEIFINHMEEEHDEDLSFNTIPQPETVVPMNIETLEKTTPLNDKIDDSDDELESENSKNPKCSESFIKIENEEYSPNLTIFDKKKSQYEENTLDKSSEFDDSDDAFESENSTSLKCLESSIKIENVERSPKLTIFDNIDKSQYEEVTSDKYSEFPLKFDANLTKNHEVPNTNFATIDDLDIFRNDLKEQLLKTKMSIENLFNEQPETIRTVLVGILTVLRPIKDQTEINTKLPTKIIPKEPFSTIDDFLKFETEIQEDKEKYHQLVWDFKQQIAGDFQKYMRLNWKRILNDCVAQRMCWKGSDRKTAVRSLMVTQALKAASVTLYAAEADEHFDRKCILHFKHAKARLDKSISYKKSKIKKTI